MTDENNKDEEDEGITINITSNVEEDDEQTETNHEGQDSEDNDDFLDEDGTVTLGDNYEGTVRLVGTVHVSKTTRDRVVSTVQEEEPDVVAIELDQERLYDMFERGADVVEGEDVGDEDEGGTIQDLIREQQQGQFDGEDMLQPGEADMLPAVREGVDLGKEVALIDMSMEQLQENVKSNAFDEDGNLDVEIVNKVKQGSFGEVVDSVKEFVRSQREMQGRVDEEGMEGVIREMEESSVDEVAEQMDSLREVAPEIVEALIDERDQYMAGRIHWLRQNGYDTVATMGRGHLQGVYDYLNNPEDINSDYVVKPDWYEYSTIEINA